MSAETPTEAMRRCLAYYRDNEHNPDRRQTPPYTWNSRQVNTALDRDWLKVGPGGWHILSEAGRTALASARAVNSLEATERLVEELQSYLLRINQLASPHQSRVFDNLINDVGYITDYARTALASIAEWRKP